MNDLLHEELKAANKFLHKYEKAILTETNPEALAALKERARLWNDVANQARAKLLA